MSQITICSPQLGISPETNSGGEVYDREVLTHLARAGIKSFVLLPKNRPYPRHKNLQVSYTPIRSMFPPYIFNFFVFPYLIKTFKKYHFDILRVHSPYFVGAVAFLFKKIYPQVPLVASYLHLEEESFLQPFIDKMLINQFDHLIVISKFTKQEIVKRYKVSSEKITIAYPGVSRKFMPKKKKKRLLFKFNLTGKNILLFLGGLKKRKNPLFALQVFRKLNDLNTVLIVAGEGPLKKEMIFQASNLGIDDRISFTGFVNEEEKAEFYNLADIVLLPSLKEGFGMIAAEAGACGKPVIASNNSSLLEVVKDGRTGFLAETNDVDDWLKKVKTLLKSKNLRRLMGARAAKFIRTNFSWEKNAKIHLETFRNLLSSTSEVKKAKENL